MKAFYIPLALLSFWFGASIADGEGQGFVVAIMFAVGGYPWLVAGLTGFLYMGRQNKELKKRLEVLENDKD